MEPFPASLGNRYHLLISSLKMCPSVLLPHLFPAAINRKINRCFLSGAHSRSEVPGVEKAHVSWSFRPSEENALLPSHGHLGEQGGISQQEEGIMMNISSNLFQQLRI